MALEAKILDLITSGPEEQGNSSITKSYQALFPNRQDYDKLPLGIVSASPSELKAMYYGIIGAERMALLPTTGEIKTKDVAISPMAGRFSFMWTLAGSKPDYQTDLATQENILSAVNKKVSEDEFPTTDLPQGQMAIRHETIHGRNLPIHLVGVEGRVDNLPFRIVLAGPTPAEAYPLATAWQESLLHPENPKVAEFARNTLLAEISAIQGERWRENYVQPIAQILANQGFFAESISNSLQQEILVTNMLLLGFEMTKDAPIEQINDRTKLFLSIAGSSLNRNSILQKSSIEAVLEAGMLLGRKAKATHDETTISAIAHILAKQQFFKPGYSIRNAKKFVKTFYQTSEELIKSGLEEKAVSDELFNLSQKNSLFSNALNAGISEAHIRSTLSAIYNNPKKSIETPLPLAS